MRRIKIFSYTSKNDMRNIFLSFDRKDTDIFLFLNSFFEPCRMWVLSNVHRCNSIFYLSKKVNQYFQVGNFHIGDDEKIKALPPLDQRSQILQL